MVAAEEGHVEIAVIARGYGCSVELALSWAARHGRSDVVELLLDSGRMNQCDVAITLGS